MAMTIEELSAIEIHRKEETIGPEQGLDNSTIKRYNTSVVNS